MTRKSDKTPGSRSQPYQYNELPRDGSFRYLILHRGTGNDPLKCSLQTAPVSKTKFEAISYVWGKSKKNKKIICDGRIIKITKSLSNVLRRLRLPHRRRKLWADGICINQNDLGEKGHQVGIMGAIYRSARRVLIYIGSEDHGHGPRVCSLMDDVNQMIYETCEKIDMSWNSFPFFEEDDPILLDSRWKSMFNLLNQHWFQRGWVVREAAFAKCGLVIWHQSEFSWEKLMRLYTWLSQRAYQLNLHDKVPLGSLMCHHAAFVPRHKAFAQIFYSEPSLELQPLLRVLDRARDLQLSDARDRIYAFMELSESSERLVTIHPDYNLAPMEVYRRFAIQFIRESKDTSILDHVDHGFDVRDPGIPSWVPGWDVRTWSLAAVAISSNSEPLSARDGSLREPEIIGQELLFVRGVIIDSVRYISDTFKSDSTTLQAVAELWKAISHMLDDSPYEPSHRLYCFVDALCFGSYQGELSHWRRSRAAFMAYLQVKHGGSSELSHQESSSSKCHHSSSLYLSRIGNWMHGTRLIVTQRGYMGLAPAITQRDDLCGIVFGCTTPCILRPTPEDRNYKFLGATFLMGKQAYEVEGGGVAFYDPLGHEDSKDWVEWDVEEQDIYLV